ncbi:hypothetical protein E2C01_060623 [Portunus trituberculatus]|uniref:Uncharacterized protein n=1 Tax=Portunus trituberculatus TaxID=210409 RepID=A0A5B7H9Z2_PORTR|nr:hypothetical protein [Portunus trituberculatus]
MPLFEYLLGCVKVDIVPCGSSQRCTSDSLRRKCCPAQHDRRAPASGKSAIPGPGWTLAPPRLFPATFMNPKTAGGTPTRPLCDPP